MSKKIPRKKFAKIFFGIPPEAGKLIGEIGPWQLWAKTKTQLDWWTNGENEWVPVKLIHSAGLPKKGNFNLGMSTERFARNDDLAIVLEFHPEIAAWLESVRISLAVGRKPTQVKPTVRETCT